MSSLRLPAQPEAMVPPYTTMLGRSTRLIPIRAPGIFLSQPTTATVASYHCAELTISIESAITSRLASEKRIPLVPIEIPSETPAAW